MAIRTNVLTYVLRMKKIIDNLADLGNIRHLTPSNRNLELRDSDCSIPAIELVADDVIRQNLYPRVKCIAEVTQS